MQRIVANQAKIHARKIDVYCPFTAKPLQQTKVNFKYQMKKTARIH